ncbi:MFS transporter [Acinetobacter pittii]|uniref:MFS transporter n=1 Tax=Acinetobacter pittii TaxID=48296 RepID=UPI0024DE1068|nr:MFS transporter [Acinetobacter pittii]
MNTVNSARKPLFYGWWIVLISIIGMIVSQGPILVFTFGVFMTPISQEYGWTRSEISLALTLAILSASVFTPLIGRLIDRYGARSITVPALGLFGIGVMSLAFLPDQLGKFYFWFICIGALSAGGVPTAYAKTISQWFIKKRGLALGLSMAGIGFGAALMPLIAQKAISFKGWQFGYIVLGILILLGMIIVALKFKNNPQEMGLYADNLPLQQGIQDPQKNGISVRSALKTKNFWLISMAFFLAALALNGCAVHIVPMMIDRGVLPDEAARIAAVIGISLFLGRIFAGYLLDYIFAPIVTIFFFACPIVGILLLYFGATGSLAICSAALIGLGVGSEVDLIAYLVSRYFGLKAFGEIYGYLFTTFCLGTAFGPLIMGMGQTKFGSYEYVLLFFMGCLIFSCFLMCFVGKYPQLAGYSQPISDSIPDVEVQSR